MFTFKFKWKGQGFCLVGIDKQGKRGARKSRYFLFVCFLLILYKD